MAMEINAANIKNLFANGKLTETQNQLIDKATEDGALSENEIAELKAAGVDTNVIAEAIDLKETENLDANQPAAAAKAAATTTVNVPERFANDAEIQKLQAQINQNNIKISANKLTIGANNNQIDKIKEEIELLKEETKREIDEAIAKSEQIAEDQKSAMTKAVNSRINQFSESQGQMTYSAFRAALDGDIAEIAGDGASALAAVMKNMLDANEKLLSLDGKLQNIAFLLKENEDLTAENSDLACQNEMLSADISSRVESLKAAEEAAKKASESKSCDPIGFVNGDKRYDFFLDADGNGDLSNAQEFLGAEDGWSAMQALDTDGDGKVTGQEMDAAGLKMVVTGKDGTQQVINASELFNEDNEAIDLNSYKEVNADVNKDVRLLGNFDVNLNDFGGEKIEGYNTLDTLDYLNANYNFSDANMDPAKAAEMADKDVVAYTAESIQFEDLENSIAALHEDWNNAWDTIGIKPQEFDKVSDKMRAEGQDIAQGLDKQFEEFKKQQEVQEAEDAKAEEVKENQVVDEQGNVIPEEDLDKYDVVNGKATLKKNAQ